MQEQKTSDVKKVCGIVMPISSIDGCNESHWSDVLDIISEAIEETGFEANLVSNSDEVGIIQKRIIQNLYDNPVVVCDVSGKNPNVMFELGMRLAFDKPTIIIKDDRTSYSFDTSPIEHLEYPRDLRFSKINDFKNKLSQKIQATYNKSTTDESYTTFLKNFGEFTVAKIEKKEVSGQEYIIDELRFLRATLRRLERSNLKDTNDDDGLTRDGRKTLNICLKTRSKIGINKAIDMLQSNPAIDSFYIQERGLDHNHLVIKFDEEENADDIRAEIVSILGPRRTTRKRKNSEVSEQS
ncbi:hypothetical protein [Aeromonas salmonicida]|uniref:hypothetical protein n=1 Tax=Aeromonas salmonicida TaxID=645 RepID=UPI00232BA64D|nr:hypothetical protein [Aeromonas salmonicida]WCH29180.1 hypothetical protein ONZ66_10380 [Aeromonas salmonicida]